MQIDSITTTGATWRPLAATLGKDRCKDFMWMGSSGSVQLYKHILTRRYLRIDALAYAFYDQSGRPLKKEASVEYALA